MTISCGSRLSSGSSSRPGPTRSRPVDVHELAEALAAHLKLEKDEVADAIVRHCDALGVPMVLRVALPRDASFKAS